MFRALQFDDGSSRICAHHLVSSDNEWATLERLLAKRRKRGTCRRTNLKPTAPRDPTGQFLRDPINSDLLTPEGTDEDREILEHCHQMVPSFPFEAAAANSFGSADDCEWHFDRGNKGPSLLGLMRRPTFTGGGLMFRDGREFTTRWSWL